MPNISQVPRFNIINENNNEELKVACSTTQIFVVLIVFSPFCNQTFDLNTTWW